MLGGKGDLIFTGLGSGRPGMYTAVPVIVATRREPPIYSETELITYLHFYRDSKDCITSQTVEFHQQLVV